MADAGGGASQRRVATNAPVHTAAPLCVEGGGINMSNQQQQQQQYDAVLRTFSNLMCSAMATADDTKSLEGASLTTTRDLYEQRSAALPRLFSGEVLNAARAQLRAAQAAQRQAEAPAMRQQAGGGGGGRRNNNVDIMKIGSQDDSAGDDDSIWWLASAPSLDLRNKTKPLSSMLTRSLNMSPAISAAFNLSLPVRAVCGRVDELGVTSCGASTVAGSVLTNKTSLTMLPRRILQNVSASYKSLVDSRLRSSLSALLKRTLSSSSTTTTTSSSAGNACGDSAALLRAQTVGLVSLMSKSDAVVVTAAVSSFKVVDVPGGSTDEGLDSTGHLRGRTVPLIFEAVLDVIVHDVKTTAVLQAPGSLTGQFVARPGSGSSSPFSSSTPEGQQQEQEPRLARVELTVDAPHLLQMMMEEARKAVRKAVSASAANIAATTTTNATNTNLTTVNPITLNNHRAMARAHHAMAASSLEQAQKSAANLAAAVAAASGDDAEQQPPTMLPPQHNNDQRTSPLPRKVSDTVLRPGLKRKSPSFSSATPQSSKSILPKPKRRSSAFSSTGSITDEEGSVSSYVSSASLASGTSSAQQSSEGSDAIMPPPRPRSPLSKSRSSSRLLFYSGRKASTQDGFASTAAAAAAQPGRVASSKSINQNASWDHDDSRLSPSGSYSSSTSGSYSSSPGSSGSTNANAGAAESATTPSSSNASAATAAGFALLSMKKTSPKSKSSSTQKADVNARNTGTKRVRSDQSIPLKKRIVSRDG